MFAVNTFVKTWQLQIGTPAFERACVAEAAGIHVGRARQKLASWRANPDKRGKRPPRSWEYASGNLLSPYLVNDDNQEADPNDEEFGTSLQDSPWRKGSGGSYGDWVERGQRLPLWPVVSGPLHWDGAPEAVPAAPVVPAAPAAPPIQPEPIPEEEPQSKRRKLLGDFKLVETSSLATPRNNPAWENLYKGMGKQKFNKELASEGLESHKSHGAYYVRDSQTQKLVQLQ